MTDSVRFIQGLHRAVGNQAVQRLLGNPAVLPPLLQARLTVGAAGDAFEREADRVAEQVMRTPAPEAPVPGEEVRERVQASRPGADPVGEATAPPVVEEVLRGAGQPLDAGARAFLEPRFGHGFGGVRVHTGARAAESARAIQAEAYTAGANVVFGEGRYEPGTASGLRLLAHELTHVVQQGAAGAPEGAGGHVAPAGVQRSGRGKTRGEKRAVDDDDSEPPAKKPRLRSIKASVYLRDTVARGLSEEDTGTRDQIVESLKWVAKRLSGDTRLDPDEMDEVGLLIATIRELGRLANDLERPHYRDALEAIGEVSGYESRGGRGGLGTLMVEGGEVWGRPGFSEVTQDKVRIRPGKHRRHILAWHDIRDFVAMAYAKDPGTVVGTIRNVAEERSGNTALAFEQIGTYGDVDGWADDDWLKAGLFVMNGNPRNLWAGAGRVNSAINTAQYHMSDALKAVGTRPQLDALAARWGAAKKPGSIYGRATILGAQVIQAHPDDDVEAVKRLVREWVVRNLQVDVLGGGQAQNQQNFAAWRGLGRTISTIHDSIVAGTVELDSDGLAAVLRDLMTYAPPRPTGWWSSFVSWATRLAGRR